MNIKNIIHMYQNIKLRLNWKKEQQLNQPLISFDDINYNSNKNQPNIDLIDLTKQNK